MDELDLARESGRLDSLAALGQRALAAATLAQVWGDVAGFVAVELEAAAVIAIEQVEETGEVWVRAVSGASHTSAGERVDPALLARLGAPGVLDGDALPWELPGPVHVMPVAAPGGIGAPVGALLVGRPASAGPGPLLALAAHILGAASGRLRVTARALNDSAFLARATERLSRARGVNANRRAALEVLAERTPKCLLVLTQPAGGTVTLLGPALEDPAPLLDLLGADALPEAPVLTHGGSDGTTVIALPLRVGQRQLGAAVLQLDQTLERASERVPLLETLADRLALCLHNAWLLEEARREATNSANLLAVVSHDLRNPLASIMLHAEVLRRRLDRGEADRQPVEETIANILAAGRQMDRLIGDLRDEEAARRGQLRLETQPCDLVGLLEQVVSTWEPRARQAGVTLAFVPPAEPAPEVCCDAERVRQALENLLSNALNVTPADGRIEVVAAIAGEELRVCVTDTGPGVPEDAREAIFESFYRGATTRYQGLGLGLSIARSIVQMHQGRLELESPPGQGASFTMRLPVRRG